MLSRRLKRVAAAGEGLDGLAPELLHDVRLLAKRLRYAAEIFAPLWPGKATRRFLERLAALQQELGMLNDGAVAAGLLDELAARRRPPGFRCRAGAGVCRRRRGRASDQHCARLDEIPPPGAVLDLTARGRVRQGA